MALTLALSVEEQIDNKAVIVTDETANWGAGGNISYTDIDNTTYTYFLQPSITTSDGEEIDYDAINLYTEFDGPFVAQTALVFTITGANLKLSTVAYGDADTELPDGVWKFTYYVVKVGEGNVDELIYEHFIYGVIKVKVYTLLKDIPTLYLCSNSSGNKELRKIKDAMFAYSYYLGILTSSESTEGILNNYYIDRKENALNNLLTLQRMVLNGTNFSW